LRVALRDELERVGEREVRDRRVGVLVAEPPRVRDSLLVAAERDEEVGAGGARRPAARAALIGEPRQEPLRELEARERRPGVVARRRVELVEPVLEPLAEDLRVARGGRLLELSRSGQQAREDGLEDLLPGRE